MTAPTLVRPENRIVGLFPELMGTGGIQEAGRLTATALFEIGSKHGWSTDFISLNDPRGLQSLPTTGGMIPFLGFGRGKARFVLAAMARARGARIVVAAHPHLALPACQMKLMGPSIRIVTISHGIEVWKPLPALRRRAFLESDLFLAPSSYTIEQIVKVQGAARERTRRVAWPVSPSFLQLAEGQAPLSLPSGFPSGSIVLAVARQMESEKYKGIDLLIRAVAQLLPELPSTHLVVVGGGDALPRHQNLAAELHVADHVHFFETLSRHETAACYSRCDAFALPSTGEGFGLVFLEAMAFSKPVVAVAAGGVTDIVEDGQNGLLIAPGDLERLVQALQILLTNESLRVGLGERGSQVVRTRFQFAQFRAELEQILSEGSISRDASRPF